MKYGTLSNEFQGRLLVVWDHLLATLPDDAAMRRFVVFDRVGRRERALRQWETIPISIIALTDIAWRRSIPVDLVTYLGEEYVSKLRKRVEREAIPVTNIFSHTEDTLDAYARHTPFVLGVIHPNIYRPFLFGSKGIPVTSGKPWSIW